MEFINENLETAIEHFQRLNERIMNLFLSAKREEVVIVPPTLVLKRAQAIEPKTIASALIAIGFGTILFVFRKRIKRTVKNVWMCGVDFVTCKEMRLQILRLESEMRVLKKSVGEMKIKIDAEKV